jgi:hypothetical protein
VMDQAWKQSDGHSCGRLVLKAIAALLSNSSSVECKTFDGGDLHSQDEATILKDAGKYAKILGVDGTIEQPPIPISNDAVSSDID